jgi:hypothetical protein
MVVTEQQTPFPADLCPPARAIEVYVGAPVARSDRRYLSAYSKLVRRIPTYELDGLRMFSEADAAAARWLIGPQHMAEWLAMCGVPISAGGLRLAARRGALPYHQLAPGLLTLFDPLEVLASDYSPNEPRGKPGRSLVLKPAV